MYTTHLLIFTGMNPVSKVLAGFSQNLIGKIMWASASSIVFMVRADMTIVKESHLRCLRDHIDGHNKHIVRYGGHHGINLKESEVTTVKIKIDLGNHPCCIYFQVSRERRSY